VYSVYYTRVMWTHKTPRGRLSTAKILRCFRNAITRNVHRAQKFVSLFDRMIAAAAHASSVQTYESILDGVGKVNFKMSTTSRYRTRFAELFTFENIMFVCIFFF